MVLARSPLGRARRAGNRCNHDTCPSMPQTSKCAPKHAVPTSICESEAYESRSQTDAPPPPRRTTTAVACAPSIFHGRVSRAVSCKPENGQPARKIDRPVAGPPCRRRSPPRHSAVNCIGVGAQGTSRRQTARPALHMTLARHTQTLATPPPPSAMPSCLPQGSASLSGRGCRCSIGLSP